MQLYIALQKQSMGDHEYWSAVVADVCAEGDGHNWFMHTKDVQARLREMANNSDDAVMLKKLQNVQKAYEKKR